MKDRLLAKEAPHLRDEWDTERNAGLSFDTILATASQKVSWVCSKRTSHRWTTSVYHRAIGGTGCPYCAHRRIAPEDSLAGKRPELAAEWHPTKNGNRTPEQEALTGKEKRWWRCQHGHEWQRKTHYRVRYSSQCPECRLRDSSLAVKQPDLAKQWHPTKNGGLTPDRVAAGSNAKAWWLCEHGHAWHGLIRNRVTSGSGCPVCAKAKRGRRLPPLSEYSPELAAQWHPTRNGSLSPDNVSAGSTRKVWWVCPVDGAHVWAATINNRARKGAGCPQCANLKPDDTRSLAALKPEVAAFWHAEKNAPVTPHDVTVGSARRFWWRCPKDESHEWDASVTSLTTPRRGSVCPFCSGWRVSSTNNLAVAHPEIAQEWHPTKNGELTAAQVTRASGKRVWWQCKANADHEWEAMVKNRTVLHSGCPHCERERQLQRQQKRIYEAAAQTGDYIKRFKRSMTLLKRILSHDFPAHLQVRGPVYGMVHVSAVTAMETYLCDAFLHAVTHSDELMNKLLKDTPDFAERRYSLADMIEWSSKATQRIVEYVYDIPWHNIAKVRALYSTVLSVEFVGDLECIYRAVSVRHDLVHRNGRSKEGKFHTINPRSLGRLFDALTEFVEHIDKVLKSRSVIDD